MQKWVNYKLQITLQIANAFLKPSQLKTVFSTEMANSATALADEVCGGIRGYSKYLSELDSLQANLKGFTKQLVP